MKSTLQKSLAALLVSTSIAFAQGGRNRGMVNLDFHDVDIADIINSISEITGKNFLLDDKAKGKISIVSPAPVTVDEAYNIFLSALKMKGLCAVDMGSIVKVVTDKQCIEDIMPVDSEKPSGDQLVTRTIPLKYINANEIKQALDPLRSARGKLSAYGPTNSLLITDYAANIERLVNIVERLDRQNYQAAVEVIPLKHTGAQDMADKLMSILEKDRGMSRRARGSDVEGVSDISKIIPDLRTNSLIVVANRDGLGKVLDLLADLDREVVVKTDQNRVHVYRLVHADAQELAKILTALITGTTPASKKTPEKSSSASAQPASFGTPEPLPWEEDQGLAPLPPISSGSSFTRTSNSIFQDDVRVVADPSTNALVITASPTDYQSLLPVIQDLDRRRAQVFVETLIMEVSMEKAVAVGLSGHGGARGANGTAFAASQLGPFNPALISQNSSMLSAEKNPVGLVLGGMANQSFKIGNIRIPIQAGMFRALQTNGAINILSAPNILTTDNKKAEIVVGDKVPFKSQAVAVQGAAQQSITREDVGLKLFVTPKINEGSQVTLDVEQHIQEVKEFGETKELGNTERSLKSTVIVDSGQTVVLGGLIQDKENKTVSKVPLLGDIPLVGYLFRDSHVSKTKNNLLVFLTPHVIHNQEDLTRISVKKNNERRKFNKTQGIGENQALYDYELDKGLNMAPAPETNSSREEISPKRRFNYDEQPTEEEGSNPDSEGETQLSRRMPRRNLPKTEYSDYGSSSESFAEVSKKKRPSVGNPFATVRPPSSN